jgi:hypothetical protein
MAAVRLDGRSSDRAAVVMQAGYTKTVFAVQGQDCV